MIRYGFPGGPGAEGALPGLPHIPEQALLELDALHSGPLVFTHDPLNRIDETRHGHPLDEETDDDAVCALCLEEVRAENQAKTKLLEVALAEWCMAGGSQDDVLLTGAGWLFRACFHLATPDHFHHRLH